MKKIYLIAEDELVTSFGETSAETRVCHNLGAFTDQSEAQKVVDRHNKLMADVPDEAEYYVLPVDIKDCPS